MRGVKRVFGGASERGEEGEGGASERGEEGLWRS